MTYQPSNSSDAPRSEEHTSALQSHRDLHSFPTRRSSDLALALPICAASLIRRSVGREVVSPNDVSAQQQQRRSLSPSQQLHCPSCLRAVRLVGSENNAGSAAELLTFQCECGQIFTTMTHQ